MDRDNRLIETEPEGFLSDPTLKGAQGPQEVMDADAVTPIEPSPKLARLTKIGFVQVGVWTFDQDTIAIRCSQHATAVNVLYAFVVDGKPVYVGKTTQQLCKRMQQYRTPGPTQLTNKRNRLAIIETLKAGRQTLLYVLPDNGLMHYGGFHINLAAGLEDSIIRELKPIWNGGHKDDFNGSQSQHPASDDSKENRFIGDITDFRHVPDPPPDGEEGQEGIAANDRTADQVWDAMGPDYVDGWSDAANGNEPDPIRGPGYHKGYLEQKAALAQAQQRQQRP